MPTRGTTWGVYDAQLQQVISIHVPTRGTTPYLECKFTGTDFNPRAHEGHDVAAAAAVSAAVHFNPRAHEGHDARLAIFSEADGISIHVPTRGTTIMINMRIFII